MGTYYELTITSVVRETGIPVWVPKLWHPKNFSVFFFELYFNKKYVAVAINDFTMHLITSKWPKRQKCRQMRKTVRQKKVVAKDEMVYKSVFIHINTYEIMQIRAFSST